MAHFEVIGDADYDDDVEGYAGPMGDFEGSAIVGYDEYGEPIITEGEDDDDDVEGDIMGYDIMGEVGRRRRRRGRRRRGRRRIAVRRPGWRRTQLAPGVIAPDQGLLPLPMEGLQGNQFTSAINAITFQGQVQKPFRGERLLVSTVRTGATAVGRILAQLFVGTDLQQLDVTQFDAEQIGDPNAFGVRLTQKPAQPGVFIRLVTNLSVVLGVGDTIDCYVTMLGRNVH